MQQERTLRRGWTTGSCATAAAKAAYQALLSGEFPDPVTVTLPGGQRPAFALAEHRLGDGFAEAGVIKDAGDDPDVTHGALVRSRVRLLPAGSGVVFKAGEGVGHVTRPGLPVPPGEPAINPVPRRMLRQAIGDVAAAQGGAGDVEIEISIPGGAELALKTLNGRLGVVGGLSILGTTGIVVPFSCAAWIDTIHRGIDVARALGLGQIAGATGDTSEKAIQRRHGLHEAALIDMGDFVGGMLKYLRGHPVPRVSIAGGIGKMAKLAQGLLDLHSRSGRLDMARLAERAAALGADAALTAAMAAANNGAAALQLAVDAGLALGDAIAAAAWETAAAVLAGTGMELEIAVYDHEGRLVGLQDFRRVHAAPPR
ncbi:MAG TPA: cobalt-precorrin-5B (C(1))-methyltransferase [Kiloniellales bacterium]|nr:cobalt-precorrin-5B (C(1))-methyltransferase [Kiloniellales bacterium]